MWLLAAGLALAGPPDLPLTRVDDRLRVKRYRSVSGEGPAYGRGLASYGPIEAWVFPDGRIEHYRRYDGRALVEAVAYSDVGRRLSTVAYDAEGPSTVTVHGAEVGPVDVRGWRDQDVGQWTLRLPAPQPDGDGIAFGVGGAEGHAIRYVGEGDVFSPGFASAFEEWCGCVIEDRHTDWLDGQAAVRYRYRVPLLDRLVTGELWAVSDAEGAVLFAVTGPPATTAYGRAVAALARRRR